MEITGNQAEKLFFYIVDLKAGTYRRIFYSLQKKISV